jgi:DDE superfamily endonuclease
MIDRIAVLVKQYKINPNLIINFDQTGVHFIPKSNNTYELKGSQHVSVMGAEDKRQITAIIASTLTGNLLPLQLIFGGTTDKCEPAKSHHVVKSQFHITHSDNHWSTLETMKEYIERIIQPYINQTIKQHNLDRESRAIVLLDCWSVHKSKEFRNYVRRTHPNILLVYIPPNCTSQLQVADVALNYSFKHLIKIQYEDWITNEVLKQLQVNESVKLATGAKIIKPLILEWCYNSWKKLENRPELIIKGWYRCMTDIRDPYDATIQQSAFEKVIKQQLEAYDFVPKEDEIEDPNQYDHYVTDSDSDEDELDPLKRRVYGERKSTRFKQQTITNSYTIRTDQIEFDSESEMEVDK